MIDKNTQDILKGFILKLKVHDYRVDDTSINFDGDFIYFNFILTRGNWQHKVLRIKDFVNEHAYSQEHIVDNIKERILNIIEREYRMNLYDVLNG